LLAPIIFRNQYLRHEHQGVQRWQLGFPSPNDLYLFVPQTLPVSLTNNSKVPISIAIIFLSFLLAFSTFTRAFLSYIFDITWWKFITSTRIYALWVEFKFDSAYLQKRRLKTIREWKEAAAAERQKRKDENVAEKVAGKKGAAASGVEQESGVNGGAGGVEMRRIGGSAV
jgi:hypothetical protein